MIKLFLTVLVFGYLAFDQIGKALPYLGELRDCNGLVLGWRDACVIHNQLMLGSAGMPIYLASVAAIFAVVFFVIFTISVYIHAAHAALEAKNG